MAPETKAIGLTEPTENAKKPFIVACIPAYSEERTIAKVIIKTIKHVWKIVRGWQVRKRMVRIVRDRCDRPRWRGA